jgi:hypothetical protein
VLAEHAVVLTITILAGVRRLLSVLERVVRSSCCRSRHILLAGRSADRLVDAVRKTIATLNLFLLYRDGRAV